MEQWGLGFTPTSPGNRPSTRASDWTVVQVLLEHAMTMGHGASQSPEALLEKALSAGSASLRAKYATHGLRQPTLGPDTHVLLLRQLYLAHLERGHFAEARGVAEQMVALGELVEPALHDAARACIAQGDLASAAGHLRVAARSAPAQRRALHLWTLGRVLYLNEQYAEAVAAFERALRWATGNQTLYRAHIALAKARLANLGRGEVSGLRDHYEALTKLDPLPLYAEYVAAELLRELDREALANDLLRRFIKQAERSPIETAVGLRAEIERAKRWLSQSP